MRVPPLSSIADFFFDNIRTKQEEIAKKKKDYQDKTGGGGCCGKKRPTPFVNDELDKP